MTIKPDIPKSEISDLIGQFYNSPILDLAPLGTGHIALVYSFRVGNQELVMRLVENTMAHTLKKEAVIANLLQGSDVPLPPILHEGQYADYYFAIAPRAPGQTLDEITPEQYAETLPEIIKMLDLIHQVDVSSTRGYGFFEETAVGAFPSWPNYLLTVGKEEDEGFFGQWHHLFEDSFLERPLFDQLYTEMQRLFPYLPTERYLIHGDYGFNNVLADRGRVTAVLDWANAKFGDFLFDVAYLTNSNRANYITEFEQFYHTQKRDVPHYFERIRCYQCFINLDGLRFFAQTGSRDGYEWTKGNIAKNLGF
ncbi:phosphotransferase family protein [Candidatus Leptofilum sp.]|uniref:phosphotransferase family protein n=1 Tax=Candidatus Leptofilum sp. TaxID=3241576 RepID=UPI003B59A6A0